MTIHTIFDILALFVGVAISKLIKPQTPFISDEDLRYRYYIVLILGVTLGAFGVGTLNTFISLENHTIGKSVFGALFGGILGAEIFKKYHHINGSTGAYFVPSLAIGIAIGRIGCFLSGMKDYTYGIETSLPWGYDFGDHILRHPVQLYESFAMGLFFIFSLYLLRYHKFYFEQKAFYLFIGFYSFQRFIWEFLKPYESIIMGLNTFQLGSLALLSYSVYFYKKEDKG